MEFDRSTQAKSWIFDEASLRACRQEAACYMEPPSPQLANQVQSRVRKFASGYHSRPQKAPCTTTSPNVSLRNQEIMIHFHAHQIQSLVGPGALLAELRTNSTVLSTAIMLFRRFYLSNSIIEVSPRKMAVASAFFAAKVEDQKVELRALSQATALVQMRVEDAPLCRRELRAVSVPEIEVAELLLIEGVNYQFHCHHPAATAQLADFCKHQRDNNSGLAPNASSDLHFEENIMHHSCVEVLQRTLVFSDAPFLFNPHHIAHAIAAVVARQIGKHGAPKQAFVDFLATKYPDEDIEALTASVQRVVRSLYLCAEMDLRPHYGREAQVISERADELRHALGEIATARMYRRMERRTTAPPKRKRFEVDFTPPRQLRHARKYAKVTPTQKCEHY